MVKWELSSIMSRSAYDKDIQTTGEQRRGGGFLFAVRSLPSWYYVDDDEAVGRSVGRFTPG